MDTFKEQYKFIFERSKATGETRRLEIPRENIRIAVQVIPGENMHQITLTIAKRGRRVSTTDEIKYRKLCNVPDTSQRVPKQSTEQNRRVEQETEWFLIGFRWTEAMLSK